MHSYKYDVNRAEQLAADTSEGKKVASPVIVNGRCYLASSTSCHVKLQQSLLDNRQGAGVLQIMMFADRGYVALVTSGVFWFIWIFYYCQHSF
ncbi:hypothetical protein D3C77_523460 [compost metagenome]